MTARAYVMRPDDAPAFWQIRNLWHVVATGVQTGGSFCAIDQIVNTNGGGPPTHYHTQDEGMYIISGHCSYSPAGEALLAGPGSFVSIPRYAEHSFVVDAPDTRFLNFYLPAGFDVLLMGLAVPALRNELPTAEDHVPLPPRRLVEQLSRDYGAVPVIALPFADHPSPANMVTKASAAAAVPRAGVLVRRWPVVDPGGRGIERWQLLPVRRTAAAWVDRSAPRPIHRRRGDLRAGRHAQRAAGRSGGDRTNKLARLHPAWDRSRGAGHERHGPRSQPLHAGGDGARRRGGGRTHRDEHAAATRMAATRVVAGGAELAPVAGWAVGPGRGEPVALARPSIWMARSTRRWTT